MRNEMFGLNNVHHLIDRIQFAAEVQLPVRSNKNVDGFLHWSFVPVVKKKNGSL